MSDPKLLQAARQMRQAVGLKETELQDTRRQIDAKRQEIQQRTNQLQQETNQQMQQLQQELQQAISQINNEIRLKETELNSLRHQAHDMETQALNEKILPR